MLKLRSLKEFAALFQIIQNQRVRILDKYACPVGFLCHVALGIHELHKRHIIGAADTGIVLTEGRSRMNDTSTITGSYIAVAHYKESLLPEVLGKRIQRLILAMLQSLALEAVNDGALTFLVGKDGLHQCLCHNQVLPLIAYLYIVNLRIYNQTKVGRQCPRGSSPGQEVGIFLILCRKLNHGGTLLDILVALCHLMGGQRRTAARAIRHNLVSLVKQPFLPDFVKSPPYRLDIIILISNIRVLHVSPEAYHIGEFLPHALVLPNGLTALLDKRLNAVLLNLLLAVQSQKLLNLQLYRQAVGIPASLAENLLALHGLVTRQHILDDAGQHMADVRLAVGSRRTIVKCEGITAFTIGNALIGNIVFLPEFQHLGFTLDKVQICVNLVVHAFYLLKQQTK